MSSESKRSTLPFEPAKRKKAAKNSKDTQTPASGVRTPPSLGGADGGVKEGKSPPIAKATKESKDRPVTTAQMAIPDVVSRRMIRRIALWCGVPTALGISTFIASYFIVSHHWFPLPNVAVVLVSMGFFGLGVLGLSYGVLSASWDEEIPGSMVGWSEFTTNWGRMTDAWRSARKKN